MENGPFIDGLPIKNCDFPWLCYLNNQMVSLFGRTPPSLLNRPEVDITQNHFTDWIIGSLAKEPGLQDYAVLGHSGESAQIPFVEFGKPPANRSGPGFSHR